jgi:hypothetical protein
MFKNKNIRYVPSFRPASPQAMVPGSKFWVPGFKFQVSSFRFQVPGFKFQVPSLDDSETTLEPF